MSSQRLNVISTSLRSGYTAFAPETEEQRALVREHLDRILASPVFRQSKRYASVLRYIVEHALEDAGGHLKERTIGTEVFGRAPDYDTTTDHVVRSAAAEIRKRLAQYYQEEGNDAEFRIEVQPGSYLPQFRLAIEPVIAPPLEPELPFQFDAEPAQILLQSPPRFSRFFRGRVRLALICGVIAAGALAGVRLFAWPADPLEQLWRPVFSSSSPILLCVGDQQGGRRAGANPTATITPAPVALKDYLHLRSQTMQVDDAMTLARFTGLLQAKGKPYRMLSQSEATFTDLQNGPAILIGLLNNDWTERLVGRLRFSVGSAGPDRVVIRDSKNPGNNDWLVDYSTPYLEVAKDYALVVRLLDPKTDQMVVTAAGISVFGTLAAGEFLTNPNEIRKLESVAPKGWQRKNFELVLSTDVIRGKSGRATIAASNFW